MSSSGLGGGGAQQRRGKTTNTEKSSPATVLVESNYTGGENSTSELKKNNDPLSAPPVVTIPSGKPAVVATVRRKFCGTGPFDRHWLNVDCCGLFCAVITYGLHLYGVYAVCLVLIPPWMSYTSTTENEATEDSASQVIRTISMAGMLHRFCFTAVAILAVISHFKAMTTDPGAVPPDAKPLEQQSQSESKSETKSLLDPPAAAPKTKRMCRRCKAYKPARAHHCSVCRRCIIKMDHHCPWVNNCVGLGNHKYFLLFVLYTFISCCYSLILVVTRFSTCGIGSRRAVVGRHMHDAASAALGHHAHARAQHYTCLDKPTHLLTILGLLVEAILFGMFTSCMMFDQADVIRSKMTHIDRMKGTDVGGSLAGVTEVFGVGSSSGVGGEYARFRPDWLSPFVRVCFPSSVADEVMGFCRPCSSAARDVVDSVKNAAVSAGMMNASSASNKPQGTVRMTEIV